MKSDTMYKHKNARDVVFYCVATKSDGTAVGYYLNCHYFEIGVRDDLFLCTEDLFTININDEDWSVYHDGKINF